MAYPAQIQGEKVELGKKPVSSPSANPSSGEFQTGSGEKVQMSRTPVQSPSANPKSGEFQTACGESVQMSRTPQKGWGSAGNLPMSERSIQQSKTK